MREFVKIYTGDCLAAVEVKTFTLCQSLKRSQTHCYKGGCNDWFRRIEKWATFFRRIKLKYKIQWNCILSRRNLFFTILSWFLIMGIEQEDYINSIKIKSEPEQNNCHKVKWQKIYCIMSGYSFRWKSK